MLTVHIMSMAALTTAHCTLVTSVALWGLLWVNCHVLVSLQIVGQYNGRIRKPTGIAFVMLDFVFGRGFIF